MSGGLRLRENSSTARRFLPDGSRVIRVIQLPYLIFELVEPLNGGKTTTGVEMQTDSSGFQSARLQNEAWADTSASTVPVRPEPTEISQAVFLCMDSRPKVGKKNKSKMETKTSHPWSLLSAS